MGSNRQMNETLRKGFGKAAPEPPEDRKQSGVKDPADMSVPELVEENTVLAARMLEVNQELMDRADAAAAEVEERAEDGR